MIKLENTEVHGWEAAIRGMRNPKNSWDKSDSKFYADRDVDYGCDHRCETCKHFGIRDDLDSSFVSKILNSQYDCSYVGKNDLKLMQTLADAGPVHGKFRRMIIVYVDITAPLYWWKEFDTYKVGTVANSCSTMHKIADKEFTFNDFSMDHLFGYNIPGSFIPDCFNVIEHDNVTTALWTSKDLMAVTIDALNFYRKRYLETNDKKYWWQLIQLLPSSYNQKRTIMMNYEVLSNIYHYRKDHKLDEWHEVCNWIEELPYSELIIGGVK